MLWYIVKALIFCRTEALEYDWNESTNTSMKLWFWYDSNLLEKKTEEFSLGPRDFMGSVGGSLGLFLGFSLFSYSAMFLDSCFERINN